MDYSFHLQQGQRLLDKQDFASIKQALEHFREANLISDQNKIAKPKTLYFLALGNYLIGQIEQSYKIAFKAKRSIEIAIENSAFTIGNIAFTMNNMRQNFGEEDIDYLIHHIKDNFSEQVLLINTNIDDFDENKLDFSKLYYLYATTEKEEKEEIEANFKIDELSDELLHATFFGLCRTNDELIYFDKLKADVLSYVEGYLSTHLGDQSISNRTLSNRISNKEVFDLVDEDRYILIDRLKLTDFLAEFKLKTNEIQPFYSFIEYFESTIIQDFKYNDELTIDDLACSNHILNRFLEIFRIKFQAKYTELAEEFSTILNNTQKSLAIAWIEKNVFNSTHINEAQLSAISFIERLNLRKNCAKNRDVKSLLAIAKYSFIKGSAATNETYFPELCYYYGRLHKINELKEFLSDKQLYLFTLSESSKEMAEKLFSIGIKFPDLDESEIAYLEEKYCNSKTFELFDIIMFDCDLLKRPIKKYDTSLLKIRHTEFDNNFLLEVYDCFSKNEDLDDGYSKMFVYDRINNAIIQKKYESLGLSEYCIIQPILSNDFYKLLNEKFGEACADKITQDLCFDADWETFIKSNSYLLDADSIEEACYEYFNDQSKVSEVKSQVARFWLNKINSYEYKLS
jgi:hypothetical protein